MKNTLPKPAGPFIPGRVDPNEGYSHPGGFYMKLGCHHTAGGKNGLTACGGCYARAVEALRGVRDTGDPVIAAAVLETSRAEGEELAEQKGRKR